MLNISEERSKFSFDEVRRELDSRPNANGDKREFTSFMKKLPSLLAVNGILKVIPYLLTSRRGTPYWTYQRFETWLNGDRLAFNWPDPENDQLSLRVQTVDSRTLRDINRECVELSAWLKHWTQALAPEEEDAGSGSENGDHS
ncbi:type III-B CRISPR module-associated protein Cmr5 [Paludibaculum fermentans]|uniref:type III-B CRISPR module-associated protein Cmr5 n=1 Tax=Paludibaculum fermentans TaxID=1473598 RepID=UPI003EB7BE60